MSQQVELLELSRTFENLLTELFGASGQGLHQKVNSVEDQLPPDLTKKLRFVAAVRNAVVHKSDVDAATLENIRARGAEAIQYLESQRPETVAFSGGVIAVVLLIALVIGLAFSAFR